MNQNRWVVSVPGTSVTEYYRPTVLAQTTHHYSATALGRKTKRLVVLDQPDNVYAITPLRFTLTIQIPS